MPKRRHTVRRSIAAMAAAASLAALPMAAAASSLPGSPLYGLELRMERIQLALTGTPSEDAVFRMGLVEERIDEATQLVEAGGSEEDILTAVLLAQAELKRVEEFVATSADTDVLQELGARAAAAEQSLRDAAGSLSDTGYAFDEALDTSIDIQNAIDEALGLLPAVAGPQIADAQTITASGDSTIAYDARSSRPQGTDPSTTKPNDDDAIKKSIDGRKKDIDNTTEGCEAIGSDQGLGDWTVQFAHMMCSGGLE